MPCRHKLMRLPPHAALWPLLPTSSRRADWEHELIPASAYVDACQARQDADRQEKSAALAREQARLAEIAAAQERTGRLQLRARRTLAAMAALIAAGLGLAIWQYQANAARRVQLEGDAQII